MKYHVLVTKRGYASRTAAQFIILTWKYSRSPMSDNLCKRNTVAVMFRDDCSAKIAQGRISKTEIPM